MDGQIKEAREYFGEHLSHMHIEQVKDEVIAELLGRDYIKNLRFPMRMDCLYDHLLSQGLCDVTE